MTTRKGFSIIYTTRITVMSTVNDNTLDRVQLGLWLGSCKILDGIVNWDESS